MTPTVYAYFVYLILSMALTFWVARTLFKNGRVFLVDSFLGNESLADSVNHLLVVGFYLVNLGYITINLKTREKLLNLQDVIELLSSKMGFVLMVLGIIHFSNILIFSKMRRKGQNQAYRSGPFVNPPPPLP